MKQAAFATAALSLATLALAALPPLPESVLRQDANEVVVGTVISVVTTEERRDQHWADQLYEIKVAVQTVEKGVGVQPGLPVISHGRRVLERPPGWVGPVGVYAIEGAKAGVKLRLYLYDDQGKMDVMTPNGLEVLETP